MPVLPAVPSTIVPPGFSAPDARAPCTIDRAGGDRNRAVMIGDSRRPIRERQQLIQSVAAAVANYAGGGGA